MAISYNDVPLPNQQIDQSQLPIRTNFNSITALIDVDHETFVDNKHGYHKAIHIVDGVPAPALVAGEAGFYVDTNNLFIQKGTSTAVSLTSTTGSIPEGSYVLPNGLKVIWGIYTHTASLGSSQTYTFTFHTAFVTSIFNVQLSTMTNAGNTDGQFLSYLSTTTLTGGTAFQRLLIGLGTTVPKFSYVAIGI